MTVPERLEDWAFETVSTLCGAGRVETDFKLDLPDAGSLTKACCAFANSYGGFIIFGVKDQAQKLLDPCGLGPSREIARRLWEQAESGSDRIGEIAACKVAHTPRS